MAVGAPPGNGSGSDDDGFVYEGIKLQTADDYKQHRKVQVLLDAQETFLDRRETAYEYLWEGRIGREDYLKAIRMAAERYLMLSKQAIQEGKFAQWYWLGEPPTLRNNSPFGTNEAGERELVAVRADKEIELPNGETRTAHELVKIENDPRRKTRFRVKRPVLYLDDNGEPPFGTEPNILGVLPMREVDKQLVFQGIESFWDAPDPIIRESESVEDHPTRLRETQSQVHRYQVPEDVSMAVYDQINEFWWQTGMNIKLDRGQTIIKDFDMSHHEKYVHTDGSPPV